jgi:quinol monooxygenase YgiN
MPKPLLAAAIGLVAAVSMSGPAFAQGADQPTYVVTYIEVAPKAVAETRGLIATHCTDARKAPGMLEMDALQRLGRLNHFAILEKWQTAKARDDYAATDTAKSFVAGLGPVLIAGYDERPHVPLTVGSPEAALSGPLVVLTHVDLIPTFKEAGVAKVKEFAEANRGSDGNLRFDVLTQASRANHMTVIESWASAAAKEANIASPLGRTFRQNLMPMSGSLYDEREYSVLKCG